MYNRYVLQPDGSYRRSQVPDRHPPAHRPQLPQECKPDLEPDVITPPPTSTCGQCPNRPHAPRPQPRPKRNSPPECNNLGVGSFLKNLLPGNFDTEDLLVVLLLLLMSGECHDDRNMPLLTLALYLFL